jgi:hypothetical protein
VSCQCSRTYASWALTAGLNDAVLASLTDASAASVDGTARALSPDAADAAAVDASGVWASDQTTPPLTARSPTAAAATTSLVRRTRMLGEGDVFGIDSNVWSLPVRPLNGGQGMPNGSARVGAASASRS